MSGSEREPWLMLRQLPWDRPRLPKRGRARVVPAAGRPRGPVSGEAINALTKAMQWADEIERGLTTRAEIARREGVPRARVTQLMRLLHLGQDERDATSSGANVCSIRQAIAAAWGRGLGTALTRAEVLQGTANLAAERDQGC